MDQVETTARAMCRADGHDPDQPIPGAPPASPGEGAASPGEGAAAAAPRPRWHAYEPQARGLVAAQTALIAGR